MQRRERRLLYLELLENYQFWAQTEASLLSEIVQEIPEDIVTACRPQNNHTLLHHVVGADRDISVIRTLTDIGVEINAPNHNGNTPLHLVAQRCSRPDVAKHLVQYGADVTYINKSGLNPYQASIQHNGNLEVREVIRYETDLNGPSLEDVAATTVNNQWQNAYFDGISRALTESTPGGGIDTPFHRVAAWQAKTQALTRDMSLDPGEYLQDVITRAYQQGRSDGTLAFLGVKAGFDESDNFNHLIFQEIASGLYGDDPKAFSEANSKLEVHILGCLIRPRK